jgi:uncharacterized protein (TIGR03437 family)
MVAAGSVFRVDTFNLTDRSEDSPTPVATLAGVQMSVSDAAGTTLSVPLTMAGPLFVEAVMPDSAVPGPAVLFVQPPQGALISQPIHIRPNAPGLYFEPGTALPNGYASDSEGNLFPLATCQDGRGCYTTHLPLSSTAGGLDFVLYGTGVRLSPAAVRMRIGTHTVDAVEVVGHPDYAGVDELHFHLPQDFALHLFQVISVETPETSSNYLGIYLE